VIFAAATDGTMQLRAFSREGEGPSANRYSTEQDERFVAGVRAQFGL
jgi:hypothetical protein